VSDADTLGTLLTIVFLIFAALAAVLAGRKGAAETLSETQIETVGK
jgi:hypothetical protein